MIRLSTLLWVAVISISAFLLYSVKYEVMSLRTQIAQASHQLEIERESLNVVSAEWAYLNRPERLENLAQKYLSTEELTVDRVADIEMIPFPKTTEASNQSASGITPASMTHSGGE